MWTGIFFIGLVVVIVLALRDPIWWTMAACYVYFAIPPVEFQAPGAPYQAGFFALGVVFSMFYYGKYAKWGLEIVYEQAELVAKKAIEAVRQPLNDALVTAVLQGRLPGEIRQMMAEASDAIAVGIVDTECPRRLTVVVRRAVQTTLNHAIHEAQSEAQRILEQGDIRTKGNLRVVVEARALPRLNEALEKDLLKNVRQNVDELLETDRKESPERPATVGVLDMPLPKGPLFGVFGNIGIWAHVAFTLMTLAFGQQALYDKPAALAKVLTCLLLFIPLVGITASIRTERHFWMVVLAWLFGTWHICMNGVFYWVQYGGRADNAGGQGGESNFLGGIICMVAPVAFSLALNAKHGWHKALGLAVAGCYVLGILASGSRAGLLALMAGMGYWMIETNRRFLAVGLLTFAAVGFLFIAPADFWKKMSTIVEPSGANPWVQHMVEPSKHERVVLWGLAIKLWKEHPITGIGAMNFPIVSAEETDFTDAYKGQRGLQTHNTWLQLLAEYGSFGGIVWGGMYFLSIAMYRRARSKMKGFEGYEWFVAMCVGLEAGALAHAVTLTFNSFQWYDYIYWHFIFGPLALEVATYTSARLKWMQPGDFTQARPPPRYGPPTTEGLDLDAIDMADISPLQTGSRTG